MLHAKKKLMMTEISPCMQGGKRPYSGILAESVLIFRNTFLTVFHRSDLSCPGFCGDPEMGYLPIFFLDPFRRYSIYRKIVVTGIARKPGTLDRGAAALSGGGRQGPGALAEAKTRVYRIGLSSSGHGLLASNVRMARSGSRRFLSVFAAVNPSGNVSCPETTPKVRLVLFKDPEAT